MEAGGVIATALVVFGGLIATVFTRRSAKEDKVVIGYSTLTTAQTNELNRLFTRVETLETQAAAARKRETAARLAAREHEKWDQKAAARLRQLSEEPFPDPPPLDVS